MANPSVARDLDTGQPTAGGRALRIFTATGVLALAAFAFALSYDALHALADDAGIRPELALLWPLVVDGFIVVASLSVLAFGRAGRSTAYPWTLVGLFSALSVVFNVAHAPDELIVQAVAAIPPLALVLAFELFVRQLTPTRTRPRPTTDTDPTRPATDRPELSPADPDQDPTETAPTRTHPAENPHSDPNTRDRARQLYDQHQATGRTLTGAALARSLGISERYGQRLVAEFRAEQPADPTGNGHPEANNGEAER